MKKHSANFDWKLLEVAHCAGIAVMCLMAAGLSGLGAAAQETAPRDASAAPGPAVEAAATSAERPAADADDIDKVVQTILDEDVSEQVLSEDNCISTLRYKKIKLIDEHRALFYGVSKNQVWLNHYVHKCVGMRKGTKIVVNVRGNRLCRHDHIELIDPFLDHVTSIAKCRLGKFSQIPMEQAELIVRSLEEKDE